MGDFSALSFPVVLCSSFSMNIPKRYSDLIKPIIMRQQNSFAFNPLFFFLLLGLSLTFSCNNNNNDNDGISLGDGCNASWKVNGDDYSIEDMGLCVFFDNNLTMSAFTAGGPFLMQIDPIGAPGTFQFDSSDPDQSVLLVIELTDGRSIGMLSGQIVVSDISTDKASGTFSGTFFDLNDLNMAPDFNVTDGKFNANF